MRRTPDGSSSLHQFGGKIASETLESLGFAITLARRRSYSLRL